MGADGGDRGGKDPVQDGGQDLGAFVAAAHQGRRERGKAGDVDEHGPGWQRPAAAPLEISVLHKSRNQVAHRLRQYSIPRRSGQIDGRGDS
jgi:hypothetical protein